MTHYEVPYDGAYTGVWSGHVLKIDYFGGQLTTKTETGVRGVDVPVRLRIIGGKVREDSIRPVEKATE